MSATDKLLPVIAIVGRPNVGKSTLFNQLTHSRNALVSAFPGTTRDRQFGEVSHLNREFIIIDTGGIAEDDEVGKLITTQAQQAIEDADKLLFVIDGKAGITPEDYRIAEFLRKSGKPLLLTINKTESQDPDVITSEGYELGLGTPLAISAAHKRGLQGLIMALQPEENKQAIEEENSKDKGIKLAIVGKPNVGKSTLTNRMLGEDRVIAHDMPGTTRDSIFIPMERHGQSYTLIDTAGVRRRKSVKELPEKFSVVKTLQAIENSNVVLFLIDARNNVTEQDMKLLDFVLQCGKALVIAVNKWDNMDDDAKEEVKQELDRRLGFVGFARMHFISALHGSGVGKLFDSVNEAYECARRTLKTPELTRMLEQAIESHSPPLVKGRRVKLRYAHPGGHNPPRIIIHGNQLNALPESYRKYLANYYQKRLKLFGTPIFIEFKTSENPYA